MGFSINAKNHVHTYEAYRVPKGTTVKDAAGEDIVLSTDEDKLVLTEKAGKQLVKDRLEYSTLLQNDISNKSAKTQAEAQKQFAKTQAKAIAVFRSLSDGKIVPDSDEKKLMEYDPKLYQMAKMAQMLAQRTKEDAEKKKSEWDPIQEEKDRKRLKELNDANIDFSSLQTMNLGNGIIGTFVDLSL